MYRRAVAKGLQLVVTGKRRTLTTPSHCCSQIIIRNPFPTHHHFGIGGGGIRLISSEAPPPPPPGIERETPIISSSTLTAAGNGTKGGDRRRKRNVDGFGYDDEQAPVLAASLLHVNKLGWSEAAFFAGARDVSACPSIAFSTPDKQAVLVEYFMDQCLQQLIDIIDSGDLNLQDLVPSERVAKLVKLRLQMQAPYISKWSQALSIQDQPSNRRTRNYQLGKLADEFWHVPEYEGNSMDRGSKRCVIGGIYLPTEVFMLTDNSTDFHDTWLFLNDRVRNTFDYTEETLQEIKCLAEAAGVDISIPANDDVLSSIRLIVGKLESADSERRKREEREFREGFIPRLKEEMSRLRGKGERCCLSWSSGYTGERCTFPASKGL